MFRAGFSSRSLRLFSVRDKPLITDKVVKLPVLFHVNRLSGLLRTQRRRNDRVSTADFSER